MGCDINMKIQIKTSRGWETAYHDDYNERNYALFGWLADVRNYSGIKPLDKPRGYPNDYRVEYDMDRHLASWFNLEELDQINYDQIIEDRRYTVQIAPNAWNGGATCTQGQGERMTLRNFLGQHFIQWLTNLHVEVNGRDCRIVFDFDN